MSIESKTKLALGIAAGIPLLVLAGQLVLRRNPAVIDQCQRREIFRDCVDRWSKMSTYKVDDTFERCEDIARKQSYRLRSEVLPSCRNE